MKDNQYNLLTLDVASILKEYEPIKVSNENYGICIDFRNNTLVKNKVISSVDSYTENALFFQLRKVLNLKSEDSDSLRNSIIFLDFQSVFRDLSGKEKEGRAKTLSKEYLESKKATTTELLKLLFDPDYGLTILFSDDEDGKPSSVRFVAFDKSASMARNSRISFIDATIKDAMDERLRLGLDFSSIDTIPSKFYAYRGLYLSDGSRIEETDLFKLNEKTVIVLPDDKHWKKGAYRLFGDVEEEKTNNETDLSDKYWMLGEYENKKAIEITPFDGEGLIAKEYASIINEQLDAPYGFSEDYKREASSYQIRMPFTKGMLHMVDFQKFFLKHIDAHGNKTSPLWVRDYYGIRRDIRKAKIILTESMFKCCKWLKYFQKDNLRKCNLLRLKSGKLTNDPMKYYFKMFSHYEHALYVGNTDLVLSNSNRVKMNYQFLNTLSMSSDKFEEVVSRHVAQAQREAIIRDIRTTRKDSLITKDANDDTSGESRISKETASPWFVALARNEAFLSDRKVSGIINGLQDSVLKRCAIGQLDVQGECRFLSCDLMAFLINLVKCIEGVDETTLSSLKKDIIYEDRFFMASPRIKLNPEKYYGFLRNPHLSRNEQCLLRPYVAKTGSLYSEYFSHLSGVVMVSRYSLVPMALSGADHDGDLVKIVSDELIVDAIKEGAYEFSDGKPKRKLPIIQIPNTSAKPTPDKGYVPYDTIKNTFSNQIGQISNYAIRLGKMEAEGRFFLKKGENNSDLEVKNDNISTPACTVIVGLEIDAAKTGVHPTKNIDEIKKALKDSGEKDDKFLSNIDKFKDMPKGTSVKLDARGSNYVIGSSKSQKAFLKIPVTAQSDNVANIDRLSAYWAREKMHIDSMEKAAGKEAPVRNGKIRFSFQKDNPAWKDQLDQKKQCEVEQIVAAYCSVLSIATRINKTRRKFENTKFSGCIYNILKLQYDDLGNPVEQGMMPVLQALDSTYQVLNDLFISHDEAQQALKRLIDEKWQFSKETDRKDKARIILGIKDSEFDNRPEVLSLISNFDNSGYKLLYYLLKDIIGQEMKNANPDMLSEDDKDMIRILSTLEKQKENKYFSELYDEYSKSAAENEEKRVWQAKLIKKCRRHLDNLFVDKDEELRHVYALHNSIDRNSWFFWDVLSADVILGNVYDMNDSVSGGELHVK